MSLRAPVRDFAMVAVFVMSAAWSCAKDQEVSPYSDNGKSAVSGETSSFERGFCPSDSLLMPDAIQSSDRVSCREFSEEVEAGRERATMLDTQDCCECRLCPVGYVPEERTKLPCKEYVELMKKSEPGRCPDFDHGVVSMCCEVEDVDPIEACAGLPEGQGCLGDDTCDAKNTGGECCLFDGCTPKIPDRVDMSITLQGNTPYTCGDLSRLMADYFEPAGELCRKFQDGYSDVCEGNTIIFGGTTVMKFAEVWCGPGQDECPDDPNKNKPGECGCGELDVDGDGDGVYDCNDGCPDDSNKREAGECGCGVPEGTCAAEEYCGPLDAPVDTGVDHLCCLCNGCGSGVSDRHRLTVTPEGLTCLELLMEMADPANASKPGSATCDSLQRQYHEVCCNPECTPPPVDVDWGSVEPPFAQGVEPECELCKNGQYPLKPSTATAVLGWEGNQTCRDLYWMGLTGNITDQLCKPMRSYFEVPCGCLPPETTGSAPVCDICPDGLYPLRPDAHPRDTGIEGNPSCADLYWKGRTGQIPADRCGELRKDLEDPCGCWLGHE